MRTRRRPFSCHSRVSAVVQRRSSTKNRGRVKAYQHPPASKHDGEGRIPRPCKPVYATALAGRQLSLPVAERRSTLPSTRAPASTVVADVADWSSSAGNATTTISTAGPFVRWRHVVCRVDVRESGTKRHARGLVNTLRARLRVAVEKIVTHHCSHADDKRSSLGLPPLRNRSLMTLPPSLRSLSHRPNCPSSSKRSPTYRRLLAVILPLAKGPQKVQARNRSSNDSVDAAVVVGRADLRSARSSLPATALTFPTGGAGGLVRPDAGGVIR